MITVPGSVQERSISLSPFGCCRWRYARRCASRRPVFGSATNNLGSHPQPRHPPGAFRVDKLRRHVEPVLGCEGRPKPVSWRCHRPKESKKVGRASRRDKGVRSVCQSPSEGDGCRQGGRTQIIFAPVRRPEEWEVHISQKDPREYIAVYEQRKIPRLDRAASMAALNMA